MIHRKSTYFKSIYRDKTKDPATKKPVPKDANADEMARRRLIYNKIKELDKEEGGLF
jgi:hypothetical protein